MPFLKEVGEGMWRGPRGKELLSASKGWEQPYPTSSKIPRGPSPTTKREQILQQS